MLPSKRATQPWTKQISSKMRLKPKQIRQRTTVGMNLARMKTETSKKGAPMLGMTRKITMKNGALRKTKKKTKKKNGGTTSRPPLLALTRLVKLLTMRLTQRMHLQMMESMRPLSHLMVLEIPLLAPLIRPKAVSI